MVTVVAVLMLSTPGLQAADSPELLWSRRLPSELSLDDPVSAYQPSISRQPATAAVQELGTLVGEIRIPAIGLEDQVRAGVSLSVINDGVAHWVGTAGPGDDGNMVLAGHRTTHSAPFSRLDELERGDIMYFTDPTGHDVMYSVTETIIVEPQEIWITYETGDAIATLFACHPKGSARYRIVVRASLLGNGRVA